MASLGLHIDELTKLIESCNSKFNFIGITETGFHDEIKAKHSAILPDFSHFDCCAESNKGGARIYFSKELNTIPRPDLTIYKGKNVESVIREVVNEEGNFIVACIYKHPKMDAEEFITLYNNLLDKLVIEKKKSNNHGGF